MLNATRRHVGGKRKAEGGTRKRLADHHSSAFPTPHSASARQGAVAVEFAFVAPVLLALMLGLIEVNRAYDAQNLLETAAREGARFASMDREDMPMNGMTANQKLKQDVKTFMESNGFDRDDIVVEVVHADNPELEFDLDDPLNDLELFEVRVSVDYSEVSYASVDPDSNYQMVGAVTFRNGRATIAN